MSRLSDTLTHFGPMSAEEVLYKLIETCGKDEIMKSLTDYQKRHFVNISKICQFCGTANPGNLVQCSKCGCFLR